MITMQAKADLPERPKEFRFATPLLEETEVTYQRYVDADLLAVEPVISLEEEYGETSYAWIWIVGGAVIAVAGLGIFLSRNTRSIRDERPTPFLIPEQITAFTVLGLLKRIQQKNGFDETGRQELATSINRLERHYFVNAEDEEPDLNELAEVWIRRTTVSG